MKIVAPLALLVCALLVGAAHAKTMEFRVEDTIYTVNGCSTYKDGEILVPATACRAMLEGGLTWSETLQAVVFHHAPSRLTFFAGRNRVLINGEEQFLGHEAKLQGGKMHLPIGFLCEIVGAKLTRVAPDYAVIELGLFDHITSPAQRQGLQVQVAGAMFQPETYRALPTCDQLRVWADEVADMFDGEAEWDSELRAATLYIDNDTLVFFEDKDEGLLNGMPFELSRKPVLTKHTKLLIPLDSVCEMLGREYIQEGAWEILVGNPVE
jgi:hypothetical protein